MHITLINCTPDSEQLIEFAARTCYDSNEDKKSTTEQLIKKLKTKGHESPFEHAYASFHIKGVSRALSHQLVRHRLMAVSQRSQRYVSENNFPYVIPESIENRQEFQEDMKKIQEMYSKWNKVISNQDARFVLPNACKTELVISANFRELRHIFELRCSKHAQWEIRKCASIMLKLIYEQAPTVFEDQYVTFIK